MPGYVAVRVEALGDHCSEEVGSAFEFDIRARRVERREERYLAAAGIENDSLRRPRGGRADPVELQVPREWS